MVRWSHPQLQVVGLVVVIVLALPLGFVEPTDAQGSGALQVDEGPDQSTPESHQNPTEASQPEEYEGVQGHLEGLLSDRLEDATEEATAADYETARRNLDGEYDEQLARYSEAAGDSQADLFVEARAQQAQFIESNERFDELREAYREARQDGNERRASELRDQMQREATSISESGDGLISSYRALEGRTESNYSETVGLIEARQTAVDQFVSETANAGSVDTTLQIAADRTNISFDQPARIRGQLGTTTGGPVAEQNVSILVEDQLYRVRTDTNGQFGLVHRPVDSRGVSTLDIAFLPNATSEYRATGRELPVTVSQVESAVRIDPPDSAASFETNLTTEGVVVAGSQNRPAPQVPVALFVDNQRLQTVDTNETGRFEFSTAVPRSTTSGEASIEVRTVGSNQSITPSIDTSRVRIEPVTTSISLQTNTTETGSQSVPVTGSLKTASGKPIPGSSIELTVDGDTVDTVSTTRNGTFERTVRLSEDADNSTATIGAMYAGSGTHLQPTAETVALQPATASESLQPQSPQQEADLSPLRLPASDLLFVGGGMLAVFGLLGFWWVRRGGTGLPEGSTADGAIQTTSTPQSSRTLFGIAEQQLESNAYETAIVVAYVAVRRRLGQAFGFPEGITHRELSRLYADTDGSHSELVERITEEYEQVRYTAETVDEPTATAAVSAAGQVLDEVHHSENESE